MDAAPMRLGVSAISRGAGGELTFHFVNYDRDEPKEKRSPGGGIKDEKPRAVDGVKANVRLPAGAKVTAVRVAIPEAAEPVAVPFEAREGRLRFTVPRFLVYAVARVELR
jgi:hypothetical protein